MAKGGNFEREISKQLSLWFTDGKSELGFYRTAGSGGRATSRHRGKKEVKQEDFGDIKAETDECKPFTDFFCIELKTGYATKSKSTAKKHEGNQVIKLNNWAILDELDSRKEKSQFITFWEQVVRDADLTNREPLLIFRREQKYPCIAMYTDLFDTFNSDFGFCKANYISFVSQQYSITVLNLKEFLTWTQGKINQKYMKKLKKDFK